MARNPIPLFCAAPHAFSAHESFRGFFYFPPMIQLSSSPCRSRSKRACFLLLLASIDPCMHSCRALQSMSGSESTSGNHLPQLRSIRMLSSGSKMLPLYVNQSIPFLRQQARTCSILFFARCQSFVVMFLFCVIISITVLPFGWWCEWELV